MSASLYRPVPLVLRVNVLPFALGYLALVVGYFQDVLGEGELCLIGVPVLAFCHVFTFLMGHWSIGWYTFFNCWKVQCEVWNRSVLKLFLQVQQVTRATLVKVISCFTS